MLFISTLKLIVWFKDINTINISFKSQINIFATLALWLSLCLLIFPEQAIAQQKILFLTTNTNPHVDFQEVVDNVILEFENQVGVGNVFLQQNLHLPNAITASTFTAAPGPYDAVIVLSGYLPTHASNWAPINQAVSQRKSPAFYFFIDGCCSLANNSSQLIQTVNLATGFNVGIYGDVVGIVNFPLNTAQPISTSFTNLNPLSGGFTSFIGNVPVANALYLAYGVTLPITTPKTTVYGLFVPRSESYNGKGSCLFAVVDATPFQNPSWPYNKNKMAPAFLAAIDPLTGSCGKGGLRLIKKLVNAPSGGASGTYDFAVNCSNPTATYTASVTLNSGQMSGETFVSPEEGSTNCVVTETGKPNAPSGTQWQAPTISTLASPLPLLGAFANINNPLVKTLRINKSLSLPSGITGPFEFKFTATCDLPSAGSTFGPVTLSNFPSTTSVDIPNVPATANCSLSEELPTAPDGWTWSTPTFGNWSNISVGQSSTVTNTLTRILNINKTVTAGPTAVNGNPLQHDITYRVTVTNTTSSASSYTLTDIFGLDPDVSVVGSPTVVTGGGAGSASASFTGAGTQTTLVSNQAIAAFAEHTFDITIRIVLNQFTAVNNSCTGNSGRGLFNSTNLTVGTDQQSTNACADTPDFVPVDLLLRKQWNGGTPFDAVSIGATTGFSTNTTAFTSTNNGNNNITDSATVLVSLGQEGSLPSETFTVGDPLDYTSVDWVCKNSDNTGPSTTVAQGATLSLPTDSAGKTLICTLAGNAIVIDTIKTSNPASGSVIAVGDVITYSLTTTITGGDSTKPLVLTDTLSAGLTLNPSSLPSICTVSGQVITCTYPVGTAVGNHTITYTATVNSNAANRRPIIGVENTVKASVGTCSSCTITHGMSKIETFKRVELPSPSGAQGSSASIGDTLTFIITTTVSGGALTEALVLKDQLSIGLNLTSIPVGCTGGGRNLTCTLAVGTAPGVYTFRYTAVITSDAVDFVSNEVKPNNGSCKLGCSTKTPILSQVVLRIIKTANPKRVKLGDFVRYELLVENLTGPDAKNFFILDTPSPGLSFVEGSLNIEGDSNWKFSSSYPLKIDQLDLPAFKKLKVSYLMRVGAGAGRGQLCNKAWATDAKKFVNSNTTTACVARYADPDFEDTHIVGMVFEDTNGNGFKDEDEDGIAGVRLATATGAQIETDLFGLYHIEGIDPGGLSRGSNFIIKLDVTSLGEESILTTQNPLVKRLTWGVPAQFNFGVKSVNIQLPRNQAKFQNSLPVAPISNGVKP